jgi:hypothetical protein
MPAFKRNVLWDVDPGTFDYQKGIRLVLQRVLTLGTLDDVKQLLRLYSREQIKETVVAMPGWDPKVLSFISLWLDIPREQFACYATKPSRLKHWG